MSTYDSKRLDAPLRVADYTKRFIFNNVHDEWGF